MRTQVQTRIIRIPAQKWVPPGTFFGFYWRPFLKTPTQFSKLFPDLSPASLLSLHLSQHLSAIIHTIFSPPRDAMTTTALTNKDLILSGTEQRALALLGKGVTPSQTAAALGITESAISQLLSRDEFADAVAELRYKNLLSYSERDEKADSIEDRLLKKLNDCIPYLMRPMEIARIYQIINAAKRRGQSAPESITTAQEVVPLIMPTVITNKFTVNVNNQVLQAGQQPLITVQSGSMQALLSKHKESQSVELLPHGSPSPQESSKTS